MYVDIARDFDDAVFHVLLNGARGASHNHQDCCCFKLPHSLNLDFQVLVKLFCGFDWGVGVEGCHVNEKAGFILLAL